MIVKKNKIEKKNVTNKNIYNKFKYIFIFNIYYKIRLFL